jgi:TRAP-type C4-dicarboxylate transport system permease small subunit
MAGLEALASRITRWIALGGLVAFVAVALVTIVDVMMRWLFASPIDGVEEVSKLVVAIAIAAFFPAALADRHHISITFLGKLAGPRGHAWLETLSACVTSVFFFAVGWEFVAYTAQVKDAGETTWILAWPVAPWWTVVTAFMIVCIPVQVVVFVAEIGRALRGGEAPSGAALPETVSPDDGEY